MLILLASVLPLVAATAIAALSRYSPQFKHAWLTAAACAGLTFLLVFFWHLELPQSFSLFSWQPVPIFSQSPAWLADDLSWALALSISALALAVLLAAPAHQDHSSLSWSGTLLVSSVGLLSVTSANPLTLGLLWALIDLTELVIMLATAENSNQRASQVVAYAVRLASVGLLFWTSVAPSPWTDFHTPPPGAGIPLILAVGMRLGLLLWHHPLRQETNLRRGFGSSLRLISSLSSLVLLVRLPETVTPSSWQMPLLIITAIISAYSGWKWLRASDELAGRSSWIMLLSTLAIGASLNQNPTASTAWSCSMVLSGGMLFLLSVRQRHILWLPLMGLLAPSTLPLTLTASTWQAGSLSNQGPYWIFIPAIFLLFAGYIRHVVHRGESSLDSHPAWNKGTYLSGLGLLLVTSILLGTWGWSGAGRLGLWWISAIIFSGSVGLSFFSLKFLPRLRPAGLPIQSNYYKKAIEIFRQATLQLFYLLERFSHLVTNLLEGDSGILWTLLFLTLILSIFSGLR